VKVKLAISLAISPTVGKSPPIRKNNHVYIRVNPPPTQQERDADGRNWEECMAALSTVPHTIFAKVNDGSQPIYILICFPRMLHRTFDTGRWEANMPFEIQRMFWDEVLLKAFHKHVTPDSEAYTATSVQEVLLKGGSKDQRKGALYRARTTIITPDQLWKVQDTMREIIKRDPELDLFASFYFVLDAKNLKLQTRVSVARLGETANPWLSLKDEVPHLDLDYMVDRANGELTIDLALAFTPRYKTPLTGLWRLDNLEASFGAGGYQRGSLHHIASLSRYGALQAPMGAERGRRTHVIYRSSYNLQYESIRPSDNIPFFAADGDAYECNADFKAECDRRITLFEGQVRNRTFGVRDKYRMGGQALLSFLKGWKDKTREFLETEPIVWIPSDIWFRYLAARTEELEMLQRRLFNMDPRPPNYGVLTSLVCYLIREVTSTDIIPPAHALNLLQTQTVMNSFGSLFLHTLDVSNQVVIPEIQECDDDNVRKALGFKENQKPRARPNPALVAQLPSVAYPLGPCPSWTEVARVIDSNPDYLTKPFEYGTYLGLNEDTNELFLSFTNQLFILLNSNEYTLKDQIEPLKTLHDAMSFWTISGMREYLKRVEFQASNGGLHGSVRGRRELAFGNRATLFFPPEPYTVTKGQWASMVSECGYITAYQRTADNLNETARGDLDDALERIFHAVQVLPDSVFPKFGDNGEVVERGAIWRRNGDRVKVVVNPHYYKLDRLGSAPAKRTGGQHLTVSHKQFLKKLSEQSREGQRDVAVLARMQKTLRDKA
ncbi:hypothetical protein L226DRAFT_438871, partial [Lentinus tigrinus ALCF2SS1-7]|uniref:uncharacterized protein n=1 Tax=Lentinus tigrinus ALCF2SS1-7 TaxID=1328758 RepID=UPI0011662D13